MSDDKPPAVETTDDTWKPPYEVVETPYGPRWRPAGFGATPTYFACEPEALGALYRMGFLAGARSAGRGATLELRRLNDRIEGRVVDVALRETVTRVARALRKHTARWREIEERREQTLPRDEDGEFAPHTSQEGYDLAEHDTLGNCADEIERAVEELEKAAGLTTEGG